MAVATNTKPDAFWLELAGLRLRVYDWGGGDSGTGDRAGGDHRDTIVFSHPTGFLGAIWTPVIRELRRRGVGDRIITYDQRGHGMSSKLDKGYEWLHYADDLEALLEHLGVRGALGVGHSAGATTTAVTAARNPERFRRVVLIDPILFDAELLMLIRAGGTNPMADRTRTRRLVWPSRDELFENYRSRPPYDSWTDEALHIYIDEGTFDRPDGEIELLCPGRIEAQVYENSGSLNAFEYLERLDAPALVIRGETSDAFPASRAEKALAALPNARLVTVPGTTHFVPMEKIAELVDLLVAERDA